MLYSVDFVCALPSGEFYVLVFVLGMCVSSVCVLCISVFSVPCIAFMPFLANRRVP